MGRNGFAIQEAIVTFFNEEAQARAALQIAQRIHGEDGAGMVFLCAMGRWALVIVDEYEGGTDAGKLPHD